MEVINLKVNNPLLFYFTIIFTLEDPNLSHSECIFNSSKCFIAVHGHNKTSLDLANPSLLAMTCQTWGIVMLQNIAQLCS